MRAPLLILAVALAACDPPARAAEPAPRPLPPPPPDDGNDFGITQVTACGIRDGRIEAIEGIFNPATGDTVFSGGTYARHFPATAAFAQRADWFAGNEPIVYEGRRYAKYGLPVTLRPGDGVARGEYRGVPVFVEQRGGSSRLIYIPINPACLFQPYEGRGER